MTTMERIGSISHRNRTFSFVDDINEVADENEHGRRGDYDDAYYTGMSSNALMTPMPATDSYMRFEANDEEE